MKFIYPAVFRKTDRGTYKGFFPDLAECYGEGETLDEAIEEANLSDLQCFFQKVVYYRCKMHELCHLFKNFRRWRVPFSIEDFVHGRTIQITIFCQRKDFYIFVFDITGKCIRKKRHINSLQQISYILERERQE